MLAFRDRDTASGGMKMLSRTLTVIILTLGLAACQGTGSSTGGVTIPESDGTPPEATLQVAVAASGGDSAAVSTSSGNSQSMTLRAKTGQLNLAASAKDSESGVQDLQIRLSMRVTTCDGNICETSEPLNSSDPPLFSSKSPQKKPGETTAESSIMFESLDLTQKIPQGSPAPGGTITVLLSFWVKAVNHLGASAQTPHIEATYRESA